MSTMPESWLQKAGVIGMNRRNAEYIMRWNPRSLYPLVDDKVLTKKLALNHGIPTPSLIHVIHHHGDVAGFKKTLQGRHEFAVKPARGSGGGGIVLIREVTSGGFVKQSGSIMNHEEMAYHLSSILSGIYSLGGLEDKAIIEDLIHPDPVFALVTYQGVPDIRIVVYRGVPAMAMVRLPTRASDGKANLHQGAIGAGLDISRGVMLTAVHHNDAITHHPDTGNAVMGIALPNWEEILLVAARAYDMTGLGYIGVDLVMDEKRGPLLLELNARPGIQIQVANRSGLLTRLKAVDKAPASMFTTPESRVRWAKRTFAA
jgi:alpha-L-glutamate ligase-like protein